VLHSAFDYLVLSDISSITAYMLHAFATNRKAHL